MKKVALALVLASCSEYAVIPEASVVEPDVQEPDDDAPRGIPDHVATGGVEGTICANEFGGLAGATVMVEHEYGVASTATDAEGHFVLTELPVGHHVIVVEGEGFRTQIPVDVPPYDIATVRADECGDPCEVPVPCVGLAEAMDRGGAEIRYNLGNVEIRNTSDDLDICLTEWLVVTSETSQDAALGQEPSARIGPGDKHLFPYAVDVFADEGDEAWWCVERTQSTATGALYQYNGSLLPDLVHGWIEDRTDADIDGFEDHEEYGPDALQSQHNIWNTEIDNPILLVGREHSLVRLSESRPTQTVVVQAWNLGQRPGQGTVREVVPKGFAVSDASPAAQIRTLEDGATELTWEVQVSGAVQADGLPTRYDTVELSYTLGRGDNDCDGRCEGRGATADWRDTATRPWVSHSEPLVIEVCPPVEED